MHMQDVEHRIQQLEHRLRRLTRTAAVLALLLVTFVTVAATDDQDATVVRARRFEVVNDGKIMGMLEATPVGGRLRVLNKASSMTTEIGQDVSDEGTLTVYRTGRDQPAVLLDSSGMSVWQKKRSYVSITSGEHGGAITIGNKNRKDVCLIQAIESGDGEISVLDAEGKGRKLTPDR